MAKQAKTQPKAKGEGGAKTRSIRVRIDPTLKGMAEGILKELGLSSSDAIRLFYRQIVLREGLPFEVKVPNAASRKAMRDADAGKGLTSFESVDELFKDLGV